MTFTFFLRMNEMNHLNYQNSLSCLLNNCSRLNSCCLTNNYGCFQMNNWSCFEMSLSLVYSSLTRRTLKDYSCLNFLNSIRKTSCGKLNFYWNYCLLKVYCTTIWNCSVDLLCRSSLWSKVYGNYCCYGCTWLLYLTLEYCSSEYSYSYELLHFWWSMMGSSYFVQHGFY